MSAPVLVVGAGPVGLTMAAELARYGLPVRIVDRAVERSRTSKALVLWSRTLELLDRMGCTDDFLGAGHLVTGANFTVGGRRVGHVGFDGVFSPHPYALMLPQSETERVMDAHLSTLGIQVERGMELTKFTEHGEAVTAVLRGADGRQETVETSWLIGCDGAHSTVRHQLGVSFAGETLPSEWVLADLHISGIGSGPETLEMFLHEAGVLAVFPIAGDRYRVIADTSAASDAASQAEPTLDEIQTIIAQRGPEGLTVSNPVWLSRFRINERMVGDFRVERCFLAGDAAHVHSPAGGQGMNTGMQDAINLAWKLAMVSYGRAAPALLDSYSVERSAVARHVLSATGRMTAMAVLRNPVLQALRNHIAPLALGLGPVRRRIGEELTEVSIGYPDSPLSLSGPHPAGSPQAGERAPPRVGEAPFGAGRSAAFALCAEGTGAVTALLADHRALIEPELRKPFAPNHVWLVRPDGYVATTAHQNDTAPIGRFLDGLTRNGGTPAGSIR